MAELCERLKDAAAKVAADLALVLRGLPATVKSMKLAAVRFGIEGQDPIILVAWPQEPESSKPFSTGGEQDVEYPFYLVAAVPSNRALQAGEQDIAAARVALRKAYQRPTALKAALAGDALPELLQTRVRMGAPVERAKWLKGWDAAALTVYCRCVESAS
jgi:hypothetical protein